MPQLLLLPDDGAQSDKGPVNVASVPQLSPFRYPGGKTWFVPLFRQWMRAFEKLPAVLIEPFAGGGIISLTAAFEKLADQVIMAELDANVSAVWQVILGGGAERLARHIQYFEFSTESVRRELGHAPADIYERAFQTILKNRTAHGGILAEGAGLIKDGENGRGLLSRWYPQTISKRIVKISHVAGRIQFIEGDALAVIAQHGGNPRAAFFIDPPYTAGGKRAGARLYNHCEIDHERLFAMCEQIRGDFLMTYDNAAEVCALATRHGFQFRPVAMKNTHHAEMTELLIGRDLSWMDEPAAVCEEPMSIRKMPKKRRRKIRYQPKGIKKTPEK